LAGRDFIVFADNWGRHPSSTQHIFQHVVRNNRVLWVHTIGLRNPGWNAYDLKRSAEILRRFSKRQGGQADSVPNLWISNPRMLPYSSVGAIRALNRASVVRTVKAAVRDLGFTDPILVIAAPNAADYLAELGEALSVYYCIDDFTQWPGALTRRITEWEEVLLRRCDVVMATAQSLREKKTRAGRVPVYLPHGVDVEHFARSGTVVPDRVAALPKPVIGFFGAISPWVDLDLIAGIARSRPAWSIAMIGGADVDVEPLRALPNVHLFGKIPYAELPAYAQGFDVGLIPFVVNELTASVNPLKLLEYFACGLPVVSSDMPEVRRFGPAVGIARDTEGFVAAIDASLAADSQVHRRERLDIARQSSWSAVADRFCGYISAALADRTARPAPGAAAPRGM
jgi:glycosyltransferase involved in cell wall biosynthesis